MARTNFYRRIDKAQFTEALDSIGVDAFDFAFLTGSDLRRVKRWLNGDEPDIPQWVALLCALLLEAGALDLAFRVARHLKEEPVT